MAPEKGWPMPHTMFWTAMASAKTSGDQPRPSLMGVAKSPKLVLRPYVIRAIKHPHKTTKAGARLHPIAPDSNRPPPTRPQRTTPRYTIWNDRSNMMFAVMGVGGSVRLRRGRDRPRKGIRLAGTGGNDPERRNGRIVGG